MLDIDINGQADALKRALAWSDDFSLIFVHVPVGPAREELLERLRGWSGQDEVPEIQEVTLGAAEPVFQRLEALDLDPDKRVALVLMGLEQYAMARDAVSPALARLNFVRDLLPRVVPGPLVLVASDELYDSLMASAVDTVTCRQLELSVQVVRQPEAEAAGVVAKAGLKRGEPSEDAVAEVERLRGLLAGVTGRKHREKAEAALRLRLGRALLDAHKDDEADGELRSALATYRSREDTLGEANCIHHLDAARAVWTSIGRADLVAKLGPAPEPPAGEGETKP